MPMNEQERRSLEAMTAELTREDPKLGRTLRNGLRLAPAREHWWTAGVALALASVAVVLLVAGLLLAQGVPEAIGVVGLVVSVLLMCSLWMRHRPRSDPGH
jgi:hypothetical protein